jgi:hypothetical protein
MNLKKTDLLWAFPPAILLGAMLSSFQPGSWLIGFLTFSFLFLLSITVLEFLYRWAASTFRQAQAGASLSTGRTLGLIVGLAFVLRLIVGWSLHFGLPIYGHEDADDKAGFVFTDAHRRDDQAWTLARSERPVLVAFTDKFAYDQYGGLLAFDAFVYRYLSPDAQRPLILMLISAFVAALGIPFLWKAVSQVFGEKVAYASAGIFALYPESILLGAFGMREPYLLTFSALALWGFVNSGVINSGVQELAPANADSKLSYSRVALALGLLGMLLISPAVALVTLIIFAGWVYFTSERGNISWKPILIFAIVFIASLLFLSASLNRSGQFDETSPLHVINDWLRLAVKWDAYQLERDSGWVQKLFDEMPGWLRLPFISIYGILQPVLPATIVTPTKWIWKLIYILRALGWYALLPLLVLSFGAAAGAGRRPATAGSVEGSRMRNLILWLSVLAWTWILLAALRGGGDQWDNPRYRTILFLWQSLLAGYVWVWWRETRNVWFWRIIAMEVVFVVIFTQWYASRYFHLGGQLPFAIMVALIMGLWGAILGAGWWRDRMRV